MKIIVMGYSGSGKSTLTRELALRCSCPYLHLDTVHWLPNWQENDDESGSKVVADFMDANTSWVIDGNYRRYLQDRRLAEADLIVMLLFNRCICLRRALRRYKAHKGQTRDDMGDGCIEKIDAEFIWWILHKGRDARHRKRYNQLATIYDEKTVILRNPRQLNAWLANFTVTDA